MNGKEYFERVISAIDNIENETKDFNLFDFMAIMSTAIDSYAKTHELPAMEVWTSMYETARTINEVMSL